MSRKYLWLVTGGAGFIGSHLVEALVKAGERVRVVDNFSTGKLEYLEPFLSKIELVRCDIRDAGKIKNSLKSVDVVLHQAALRSVPRSVDDPVSTNEVNVTGTLNVLKAALENKVKRVVYASSSSVYGASKLMPQKVVHVPMPVSPYAVSKLTGEYYCQVFSRTYGLETVSLRYFNVFGPRQDPNSKYSAVIPKFIKAGLDGVTLEVHGDGKQSRDFSYIANVVQANLLAAVKSGVSGKVFNIACGTTTSLLELIGALEKIMNKKLLRRHTPPRSGDVRRTMADITEAKKLLGYKPEVAFDEGLRRTFEYFTNKEPKFNSKVIPECLNRER